MKILKRYWKYFSKISNRFWNVINNLWKNIRETWRKLVKKISSKFRINCEELSRNCKKISCKHCRTFAAYFEEVFWNFKNYGEILWKDILNYHQEHKFVLGILRRTFRKNLKKLAGNFEKCKKIWINSENC